MDRREWNERYASAPLLWTVDPGPFLGLEVGALVPGRVLDLGAGEGRTTLWLAARGWHVTAVDFSDVAVERGRRRAMEAGVGGTIDWVVADLEARAELSAVFERGPFDLVLVLFVHLAVEHRRRMLAGAAATLAVGGTILVVGYDSTHSGDGGPADRALLLDPDEVVAELGDLWFERAERRVVGPAVDTVVKAVRQVGSGAAATRG